MCGHSCPHQVHQRSHRPELHHRSHGQGEGDRLFPCQDFPDEAFETFVSILRVQGYAVQKSGTAYKIVPLKEGLGQGKDAAVGRKMGSELETVVTQIVP